MQIILSLINIIAFEAVSSEIDEELVQDASCHLIIAHTFTELTVLILSSDTGLNVLRWTTRNKWHPRYAWHTWFPWGTSP